MLLIPWTCTLQLRKSCLSGSEKADSLKISEADSGVNCLGSSFSWCQVLWSWLVSGFWHLPVTLNFWAGCGMWFLNLFKGGFKTRYKQVMFFPPIGVFVVCIYIIANVINRRCKRPYACILLFYWFPKHLALGFGTLRNVFFPSSQQHMYSMVHLLGSFKCIYHCRAPGRCWDISGFLFVACNSVESWKLMC